MSNKNLNGAMKAFAKASYELKYEIYRELEVDEDTSFLAFIKKYPFKVPFNEVNEEIQEWVGSFLKEVENGK